MEKKSAEKHERRKQEKQQQQQRQMSMTEEEKENDRQEELKKRWARYQTKHAECMRWWALKSQEPEVDSGSESPSWATTMSLELPDSPFEESQVQ